MSTETEVLLDRIAKLQAKAKGTTNQAEAELFAAKVAELLAKHNLDEAMLRSRDATREQGPISEHPFDGRVPDAWRERIVTGVARVYFCAVQYRKFNGKANPKGWEFVGREHNAVVAIAMASYLFAAVKRMAREHSTDRLIQANFRKGAGDKLYRRLTDLAAAQRVAPAAGAGNGMNLMVVSEDGELAVHMSGVKVGKGRGHKHGHGSSAGWDAADGIGLNTQIKETRASRMLGGQI